MIDVSQNMFEHKPNKQQNDNLYCESVLKILVCIYWVFENPANKSQNVTNHLGASIILKSIVNKAL